MSTAGENSPAPPRISVVVSTYRRASALPRLVEALEQQTLPRSQFEVVIADDGNTDDTPAVLAELQAQSPLQLRVVRNERNRGAAAGRNLGWRAARAPLIAFTDDDCRPQPQWLEAGLTGLASAAVVVGRTEPPPDQLPLEQGPFARVLRVEEPRFYETCNIFYRRADLDAAGGFDETFRTGEDTELALRVRPGGHGVVFAGNALVYHDIRPSDFLAAARETFRWTDLPLVVKLHPEVRRTLLSGRVFWKPSHPRAIAAAAGLVLAATGRRPGLLLLAAPWLEYRVSRAPLCPGPRRRWLVLPGALAIDLIEVGVMIRGSVRHRTLVL